MPWQNFYSDYHIDYEDGFGSLKDRLHEHRGLDIYRHPEGTGIPAWCAGTVRFRRDWDVDLGNEITIESEDGLRVGYCHMQAPASVSVGQYVTQGQIIGPIGNTGEQSRGVHLHTTTSWSGSYDPAEANVEDPVPYLIAARNGETDMAEIWDWRRQIDGQQRNILEALDHVTAILNTNAQRREEINARDEISRQEQTTQGAQLLAAIQALGN